MFIAVEATIRVVRIATLLSGTHLVSVMSVVSTPPAAPYISNNTSSHQYGSSCTKRDHKRNLHRRRRMTSLGDSTIRPLHLESYWQAAVGSPVLCRTGTWRREPNG